MRKLKIRNKNKDMRWVIQRTGWERESEKKLRIKQEMGGVKFLLKCSYKEILVGLELSWDQCKNKPMAGIETQTKRTDVLLWWRGRGWNELGEEHWQTYTAMCKEPAHWKRPWCWERSKAGEGDNRGWDGWMASPTQCTWVWVSSRSWWWTVRPGVLQSMGSQSVGYDRATELKLYVF